MQVVFAVIDDLFRFAKASLFGVFSIPDNREDVGCSRSQPCLLVPYTPPLIKPNSVDQFTQGNQYFVGGVDTYLYTDPVVSFDNAYTKLQYGSKVILIKFGGRWAQVQSGMQEGWVLKDLLRDHIKEVLPCFTEHTVYDSQHPETIKLRAYIDDQFHCARAGIFLTSAEYVTYRLQSKQRFILWSEQRPRIPGTWQRKLRGRTGIHIGIVPKTGSIMEYITDDIGYVLYVDAVFPDKSLKVSGVGMNEAGQYFEEIMTHEQWRELRPVFIEVY